MKHPDQQNGYQPAIVIPAFRRSHALSRLLRSVAGAHYPDSSVQVIISLEHEADPEVVNVAEHFHFPAGDVKVIQQKQQMGLRNHIIKCGDLTEEYGSVIVLEEDLMVDPWFYIYAKEALNTYRGQSEIGGIALYAPSFNEFADLPFEPLQSEWDTFFMQAGCSSGQAWSVEHWTLFMKWYKNAATESIKNNENLPDWVRFLWKETSWKKYYSGWLAEENKYMVYPTGSYSTNCSDADGEHLKRSNTLHQVSLPDPKRTDNNLSFASFNETAIYYDAFMEITGNTVRRLINMEPETVEIDLYGIKSKELLMKKEFVITSKPVRNPINSYPLMFKPLELNLIYNDEAEESAFFHHAKSNQITDFGRLSSKKYFNLAQYFLHFSPFKSRFFIIYLFRYFKELWRFLIGKKD